MSWKPEVEGIETRRRLAKELGGEEAIARQHQRGRRTVRERIAGLVDGDSFDEVGPIAGHADTDADGTLTAFLPANYVLGMARVDGRPCIVGGEDFTQSGGSPSPAGLRKSVYAEDLALRHRVPLLRFLEGAGGSVRGAGRGKTGAVGDPVYAPHRFVSIARVLESVPVVSAALGAVAGLPAARLAASHFSVMTQTSQVLIAGPALVERALGEQKTKEELGGPAVHLRSGVVDSVAADEDEAFALMRRFLSYLPTSVWELPPCTTGDDDDPNRREEMLLGIIPRNRRRIYDVRRLVEAIVDRGSWMELSKEFGPSQVTGLARLDGTPVGVLANDPYFQGGAMTAAGAQKVRRFVTLCETFHLPVVSFVDEPGFMIGSEAEAAATIRHGVETIAATVRSTVPWASVIVRKAYGVAAAAHFGPGGTVYTWPSAESGALPIEGGVAVAFRREIAAAPDPDKRRAELEEEFAKHRTPFPAAEGFSVHDLIDPRATRPTLCRWLAWSRPLLRARRD
jgi:acetyl-CoA carboxylase carboxyltransferase component